MSLNRWKDAVSRVTAYLDVAVTAAEQHVKPTAVGSLGSNSGRRHSNPDLDSVRHTHTLLN
jgi:hypothetical protein